MTYDHRGRRSRHPSGAVLLEPERLIARRREIALSGYEDGRWSVAVFLAAFELAAAPDMPLSDDAWTWALDRLHLELEALSEPISQRFVG